MKCSKSTPISSADNYETWDNTSRSEVIIAIGAHRGQLLAAHNLSSESSMLQNVKSTQTLKPKIKAIKLDLNNLQSDEDCPYGCQVDVYITARHCPGCSHEVHQEFNVGAKKFDYIGKGTYPFRMEGEEDQGLKSHSQYKKMCEEFSERCEKLLIAMSKHPDTNQSLNQKNKNLKRETIYEVIDKYSFQDDILNEHLQRDINAKFTNSEIDLYEWDFLN